MARESSKALHRQWHILRALLNGHYLSSPELVEYLHSVGVVAELRTVQRDLLMLEQLFPLEKRNSNPNSWRWQRTQHAVQAQINLSQALTLRLVEEQLGGVMPPHLIAEMQPLFEKARLMVALQSETTPTSGAVAVVSSRRNRSPQQRGIMEQNKFGFDMLFGSLLDKINDFFPADTQPKKTPQTRILFEDSPALLEMIDFLAAEGLEDLVSVLHHSPTQ